MFIVTVIDGCLLGSVVMLYLLMVETDIEILLLYKSRTVREFVLVITIFISLTFRL